MNLYRCILGANDCFKAGRFILPKGVMWHSTGANNPMLRRYVQPMPGYTDYAKLMDLLGDNPNNNDWNRAGLNVCVHAFIGKLDDGTVATMQTLPWTMRGWHAGTGTSGKSANNTHISFEICEDGLDNEDYFRAVYREAVELTAMLCKDYGLDPMEPGVVIDHSEGYRLGVASGHADISHWLRRYGLTMDDVRRDVKEKMEKEDEDDMDVNRFKELWREMRKELQDNDAAEWSAEARQWAIDNGLVQGGSDAEFNGMWEDVLTREQMVTLLFRFAQKAGLV